MIAFRLAAAASAAALTIGAASAASLPSGFYAGVNAGYDIGRTKTSATVAAGSYFATTSVASINSSTATNLNRNGPDGGVQIGYLLMSSGWGWGAEADFAYMNRSKAFSVTNLYPCCAPTTYTVGQSMERNWLSTVRGRAGFDLAGAFLYGTGGLAIGDAKYSETFSDTFAPISIQTLTKSKTKTGWTAGGGVEIPLPSNWSFKAEYLYVDLGAINLAGTLPTNAPIAGSAKFRQHVIRAGLNFHF